MEIRVIFFLVKIIPPDIKRVMIKRFPPLIQKTAMYLKFPNIDWSKTKAFVSEVDGIRINKNGKYPQGIVTKEDYEDIRDSIINGLKYIRDSGILSKFQGKIETKSPYFS